MKTSAKVMIVVALIALVAGVVVLKQSQPPASTGVASPPATQSAAKIPKLLDLGADKCIPCKAMAPILEEMKKEYAGRLDVEFIDVWKNPDAAQKHVVEIIPTQIFFDASGKELFRHTGFFAKEDMLAKWKELGFDFAGTNRLK
jgi:thioredoxin 1